MKAHGGVDSKTKMIHTVVATATHVANATVLPELLHGEEMRVWGDQAYRGQADAQSSRDLRTQATPTRQLFACCWRE